MATIGDLTATLRMDTRDFTTKMEATKGQLATTGAQFDISKRQILTQEADPRCRRCGFKEGT